MKKFILFSFFLCLSHMGFACSCAPYEANFYNNVSVYTFNCIAVFDTLDYNYVFEGREAQTSYFTLIDTINSNPSSIGAKIVLLGQDGINCGETLYGLNRGDTLVLALYSGIFNGFFPPFGLDTFYLEGVCGIHYIRITNGQHNGLTIPEIKNKILEILSATENIDNSELLSVFPNPTSDKIFIQNPTEKLISISVFDFSGRLLLFRKEEELDTTVDFSGMASGFYNLVIMTNKNRFSRVIIRQ